MKAKVLMLSISFAFVPAFCAFGQVNCATSTKLACQFPVSAVALGTGTFGPEAIPAAEQIAIPINSSLAVQLSQLPVPSATVGAISIKKEGSEVPVRFNNLGPILTDRPDTVGRGHVFTGFNYQHFNFNSLDHYSLRNLPVAFSFSDPATEANPKVHYGSEVNDIEFRLDQYVFVATAGVTQTTDLSVIIPINSNSMKVVSKDFLAYDFDIRTATYSSRQLQPGSQITTTGSASGLGDMIIGFKQMLVGQNHTRPAAAVGATFRFPSGDSFNYLGSGAMGGGVFGLVEYRARFAPHLKLAYQWNDKAKVLDIANGGRAPLPGGLQYAFGTDFSVNKKLTLNVDLLGSQFINTYSFTVTTVPFNPAPPKGSGIPANYTVISTPPNTYSTANFSGGVKWSPVSRFLLYGNALIQINNVGLRSDIAPLFGIAYNFDFAKND